MQISCNNIIINSKTDVNFYDGDYILIKNFEDAIKENGNHSVFPIHIYTSANAHKWKVDKKENELHLKWLYSHPQAYDKEYLQQYDAVMCSSAYYTRTVLRKWGLKTFVFEEAAKSLPYDTKTSYRVFEYVHIGNYKPYRHLVMAALRNSIEVHLFGEGWEEHAPPGLSHGPVTYEQSLEIYKQAHRTIDDHNPNMRNLGFLGQRAFNAVTCGCEVVTDLQNYEGIFGDIEAKSKGAYTWKIRIGDFYCIIKDIKLNSQ